MGLQKHMTLNRTKLLKQPYIYIYIYIYIYLPLFVLKTKTTSCFGINYRVYVFKYIKDNLMIFVRCAYILINKNRKFEVVIFESN